MVRIKLQIFFSIVFILLLLANCEKNLTGFRYAPEYKIACVPEGTGDLYLFDTHRVNHRLLVEGLVSQVSWSPIEPKLVYSIIPDPSIYHADLFVLNLQNNQKKLLADEEGVKYNPIFSPDGESIIYFNINSSSHERKLTLMNADGSDKKVIYSQSSAEPDIVYYWSDIPGHLVFSQSDTSATVGNLYLFDIQTKSKQFIISSEFSGYGFQTVDGNNFYYHFYDQVNKIHAINRINLEEQTEYRVLTVSLPDWIKNNFSVNPDGSKILSKLIYGKHNFT
ncbi:MAG: hypothetical protein P8048_05530, partial [Calditrichia bacterium]